MFIILAFVSENTSEAIDQNGSIARNQPGKGKRSYDLILNAKGLEKDYKYNIVVEEECLTDKEARDNIYRAEEEIDQTFYSDKESAEHVTQQVHMKEEYVNGLVKATWVLSDYKVVDIEGNINEDQINQDGNLVTAEVELSCNEIKELYTFSFVVFPRELNQQEQLLKDIEKQIGEEQKKKGSSRLTLPTRVDGITVSWGEQKSNLVLKIIILEIAVVFLLVLAQKENEKQRKKKRQDSMRLDYAEVVSKLAILLGAGMSIKQGWNRISARYSNKRQKNNIKSRAIYEEMLIASHEMQDGISERIAYQRFAERIEINEYHRLSRLLIQNLQKGNRSICSVLEDEAENAYEQRRLLAKKLGEEAGTKMLIPLMLMMVIVIAIVIFPAVLSF